VCVIGQKVSSLLSAHSLFSSLLRSNFLSRWCFSGHFPIKFNSNILLSIFVQSFVLHGKTIVIISHVILLTNFKFQLHKKFHTTWILLLFLFVKTHVWSLYICIT
jgi:hypothetical protein